ncbi:Prp18 domain-containing protein [Spinellus fusiger]|nr:Prp18 domain-containing protein [Spinellus fusiger]
MDFLKSVIADEISKKRKIIESATSKRPEKKKFVSRAEVERAREEEYHREENERIAREEEKKEKEKQRQEQAKRDQERQQAAAKENLENKEEAVETETFNISRQEVVRRLRAKGQPVRLFAETDKQCRIRLRALELMEEHSEDQGQRNDFMRQLGEMEEGMKLDALKQKGGVVDDTNIKKAKKPELVVEPITLGLLQADRDRLNMQIYAYLVHAQEEWARVMEQRPEEEKRSGQGKRAAVLQKQTAEYIKPLLRQLKRRSLEPDILARVAEITHHMQHRRYRDAQDSYLQLSIGNAPWPIGVTMVGIHERSAREKIFSSQVAHVLNDETSRKWIQSVKRLMTFAQSKYPPDTLSQIS